MVYTDYKFWFIKRNDDGFIREVAVRVHEGDYQTRVVDGENKLVYVRSKRLETFEDLKHFAKKVNDKDVIRGITESNGKFCVYYNTSDFGDNIKTDEELITFLNGEIKKDKLRDVINEQI